MSASLPPMMLNELRRIVRAALPGTMFDVAKECMRAGWEKGLKQALEGTRGEGCDCETDTTLCRVCFLVDTQLIAYGLPPSEAFAAARAAAQAAAQKAMDGDKGNG